MILSLLISSVSMQRLQPPVRFFFFLQEYVMFFFLFIPISSWVRVCLSYLETQVQRCILATVN